MAISDQRHMVLYIGHLIGSVFILNYKGGIIMYTSIVICVYFGIPSRVIDRNICQRGVRRRIILSNPLGAFLCFLICLTHYSKQLVKCVKSNNHRLIISRFELLRHPRTVSQRRNLRKHRSRQVSLHLSRRFFGSELRNRRQSVRPGALSPRWHMSGSGGLLQLRMRPRMDRTHMQHR